MKKVLMFLKREFLEMLPPTIFFFVVFHITLFSRALLAPHYGIPVTSVASATIGALIVGKSILIADALPLFRFFSQKRLIYNVLWRILLYATVVLLFLFIEELIPLVSEQGTILTAAENLFKEIKWPRFLSSLIVLISFLFVYNTATAVIGEIGRDRLLQIFFGLRHNPSAKANQKAYGADCKRLI